MSRSELRESAGVVEPLICEFCGTYIAEADQQCPALDNGRCQP